MAQSTFEWDELKNELNIKNMVFHSSKRKKHFLILIA
jgi:hypothetical protein